MSTIINISEGFKDAASEKYGEPPYGHAESSSLAMFTKRDALDLDKAMELLRASGINSTGPKQTIKEIATSNNQSPQQIYNIIKPAGMVQQVDPTTGNISFPDAPKPGWGKKVLKDVCEEYGLNVIEIIQKLSDKGVKAEVDATFKDIGTLNDLDPMGVFEALHSVVKEQANLSLIRLLITIRDKSY